MAKHFRQNKPAPGTTAPTQDTAYQVIASGYSGVHNETAHQRHEQRDSSRGHEVSATTESVSASAIAATRAQNFLQEVEPTPEEMICETLLMNTDRPKARKNKRQIPEAGKDLLASYMNQLSHIPLFTPDQEMDAARDLERAELETWYLILLAPKAVDYLREEALDIEPDLRSAIEDLEQSYRKAAARSHKKKLDPTPSRAENIERMARSLRYEDLDKDLLERIIARMRREVWGRRVLSNNIAYRLTHADMTEIERSRGAALRTRNNFVRANLRLVISVARNFHHFRIPFIDLIQEGNVGLMKAVHRFDHRRGFRFSTYAHWWIRQSVERAIVNKGSQVRLPVHVIDSRRQIKRASTKLQHAFGRAPTASELSTEMGLPVEKIEQVLGGVQQDPISLDESVNGSDPRKFLDLVRDENIPAVDEALIRENTHEHVRELLHMLNPIEKDIIRRRFGLGADTDETLDEIGKIYNLSRERVRQIQSQGLMKMRRMCERRRIN